MEEIRGKPAVGSVEVPTGWLHEGKVIKTISFREMTGYEEDILASQLPPYQKFTDVLLNCCNSIDDVSDRNVIRQLMNSMLITDRFMYLTALRMLSIGSNLTQKTQCPSCGKDDKIDYDLRQMVVENAPDPNALFKEVLLPKTQRKVRIKAGDTTSEALTFKMSKSDNVLTVALFTRIAEIDNQPPFLADVKALPTMDRNFLRKEIDQLEGDLIDKFLVRCKHCQHEYEESVQADPHSFFFQ